MRIDEYVDRTVLTVCGPLRLAEVAEWLDMARRAVARRLPVELDLREAEHMHAGAWQVLCALARELRAAGSAARVLGMSPSAANACALLGLSQELAAFAEGA